MSQLRPDLLKAFHEGLSEAQNAVATALRAADRLGIALFLAGGPVRDLLLGRKSSDIDVAVEGDVQALATAFVSGDGYRVVTHPRFGTATLRGGGFTIDFARARREAYPRPGALPLVEPADIDDDLARRDFTVNAMALRLTTPAGQLLDPHDGQADIDAGLIRALHDGSFQDDATRMLRACRYAARLGFALEAGTAALIRRDLSFVEHVSGARLRRELGLALGEPAAVDGVVVAQRFGLLTAIHPRLALRAGDGSAWREAISGRQHAPVQELGWCMVSSCEDDAGVASLAKRLNLTQRLRVALHDLVRLQALSDKLDRPGLTPPEAVDLLSPLTPAAIWAWGLKARGRVGTVCEAYLSEWRRLRSSLNGSDLLGLGLEESPLVGRALKRLRDARLTGEVRTREDEVQLVRREFTADSTRPR